MILGIGIRGSVTVGMSVSLGAANCAGGPLVASPVGLVLLVAFYLFRRRIQRSMLLAEQVPSGCFTAMLVIGMVLAGLLLISGWIGAISSCI